jgi:hypothetical protein
VWLDANGNGIQDATEAGIDGVVVNLQGAGPDGIFGTGDDIFATQTTAGGGHYEFDNLPTGKYVVKFNAPAGLVFTTANVGVNDAVDADATGKTPSRPTR